jgi:hypothetical protein
MEPTSPALEQWHQTVQQLKGGNRPRTNLQLMRQYAAVLEEAFTDSATALDQLVPDLQILPNGVVGMALGSACDRLTPEKRRAVFGWVSRQDQERADAERVYAVRGLLRLSPREAFHALRAMRSSPTKEQRERLASVLSDVPAEQIGPMFLDQIEHEIRKVIVLLLLAAQEPKSDSRTRSAVLEGVLPVVARLSLHTGSIGNEVRDRIAAVMRSTDQSSLKRMSKSLAEQAPEAIATFMPDQAEHSPTGGDPPPLGASSSAPPMPKPECDVSGHERTEVPAAPATRAAGHCPSDAPARAGIAAEATPERTEPAMIAPRDSRPSERTTASGHRIAADPLAWFDANIQMLAHAREFYLAVRADAEAARKRAEDLERLVSELQPLAARAENAENRTRYLESERAELAQKIESMSASVTSTRQELESEKQARKTSEHALVEATDAFSRERDGLQRRIDVNAEARVKDFRLAISAALSPIVRDVPSPGSERAAELGPGLLICIDQIIRALTEKGITLRRVAGENS